MSVNATPAPAAGGVGSGPTTAEVLAAAAKSLAPVSDTPRLDAELLLAFATERSRSSLVAFGERPVPHVALNRFKTLAERRARGEPLAYLTREREFFSLALEVSADVLIPRPETELLVERTLERSVTLHAPAVLDVGTGGGAVALAVKHACQNARVTGCDVSAAALVVARANAVRCALDVRWVQSRWFESLVSERFDLIVSNPPYVRSAEIVGPLTFEPRVALDGGADGLEAYRVLFAEAPQFLTSSGVLLVEHGAEQRPALCDLAARHGWRVAAAHDDLAGRPRVLELERADAP